MKKPESVQKRLRSVLERRKFHLADRCQDRLERVVRDQKKVLEVRAPRGEDRGA